ncbi:MAG: hypothetical protein IJI41_05080 [Anaerolineaceae bacterium]|nr:hypothetical protein [Anaerolineaceae bacterium]
MILFHFSSISSYFNLKYKRSGHVFESRYNSNPIESKSYLLTAFRYVLRNPQKAGICDASKYQWSSYNRYGFSESFVDTVIFQEMIGDREEYESFIAEDCEDCPELEGYGHDDSWAKSVIRDILQVQSGIELQQYDAKSRDKALQLLKSRGLTIRQIERLTGINPVAIQNA